MREELGSRIGQHVHCLHTIYTVWRVADVVTREGGKGIDLDVG